VKEGRSHYRILKKLHIEELEFVIFTFHLTFSILPTEGSFYRQNVLCHSFNRFLIGFENLLEEASVGVLSYVDVSSDFAVR
jgi:hypothetical protein